MKKLAVISICIACFLLQGCWTTMTKDNPLYGDCSVYHKENYPSIHNPHYVTVASVSARFCYGSAGENITQARSDAIHACKSKGNPDCAVYAEDNKVVLQPTIEKREMDWDSTFTMLTLGLAGATAYEANKSGSTYTPPVNAYVPSSTYSRSASRSPSNGKIAAAATPSNHAPSAGPAQNNIRAPLAPASCASYKATRYEPMWGSYVIEWRNSCNFPIEVRWCWVEPGQAKCKIDNASRTIPPGDTDIAVGPQGKAQPVASYYVCNMSDDSKICAGWD